MLSTTDNDVMSLDGARQSAEVESLTTMWLVEAHGDHGCVPDSRHLTETATTEASMAWLILVVSGALESVWAIALDKSDGFSRLVPSVVFVAALALSMFGLAVALRQLPLGTSYAVWVGIGAMLTVAYAMLSGEESASLIKVLLILGIVGCVIGLKVVNG
jgi:quaternary ammonium compound-resistance protein SugE